MTIFWILAGISVLGNLALAVWGHAKASDRTKLENIARILVGAIEPIRSALPVDPAGKISTVAKIHDVEDRLNGIVKDVTENGRGP